MQQKMKGVGAKSEVEEELQVVNAVRDPTMVTEENLKKQNTNPSSESNAAAMKEPKEHMEALEKAEEKHRKHDKEVKEEKARWRQIANEAKQAVQQLQDGYIQTFPEQYNMLKEGVPEHEILANLSREEAVIDFEDAKSIMNYFKAARDLRGE